MKKTAILLSVILAFSLLAGCGSAPATQPEVPAQSVAVIEAVQEAAETPEEAAEAPQGTADVPAEPDEDAAVAMTGSYREGRQAYFDVTGIWMPAVEGFEATYDVNRERRSICFDSQGDRALYEAARGVLEDALGEPGYEDEISVHWERANADGTVTYFELYYHDADPDDVQVFMNVY